MLENSFSFLPVFSKVAGDTGWKLFGLATGAVRNAGRSAISGPSEARLLGCTVYREVTAQFKTMPYGHQSTRSVRVA
jgi:hypothetical protein